MEKLSGMTALVTGSTDGVGRLVARKLGQAGARVLVHGRDAERGARVVADIEASGGSAAFLAADLSALAEVRRLADAARATVDRLDLLQFHVWNDAWSGDVRWQRAIEALKAEKLVRAVGISANRGEPDNCVRALRTGLIVEGPRAWAPDPVNSSASRPPSVPPRAAALASVALPLSLPPLAVHPGRRL